MQVYKNIINPSIEKLSPDQSQQQQIQVTNLTTFYQMAKTQNVHSNQNRNKKHHNHQGRQRHTAIVFDQKQRDAYLKGIFGAKNRRKQYNKNKLIEQQKQAQKDDKSQRKANRRQELQKAKDLLFKLQENKKKQDDKFEEKQVIVKQEGNIIVETKFY